MSWLTACLLKGLGVMDGRTCRVSVDEGYVNPNGTEAVLAEVYFDYEKGDCRISPSRNLPEDQRSRSLRTIYDIGLDGISLSRERCVHIEEIKRHIDSKGTRRKSPGSD